MAAVAAAVLSSSASALSTGLRSTVRSSTSSRIRRSLSLGVSAFSSSPSSTHLRVVRRSQAPLRPSPAADGKLRRGAAVVVAQAKGGDEAEGSSSTAEVAGAVAGLVSVPVVAWSLFTLKTTGCGLPPGPGGSLGALEGVSYLAILGLVGWSAYTKVTTGKGLPNGPFGLLGAAEGLAYLTLLAAAVVFGLQILDYGYIPPPVPGEQCFG